MRLVATLTVPHDIIALQSSHLFITTTDSSPTATVKEAELLGHCTLIRELKIIIVYYLANRIEGLLEDIYHDILQSH